VSGVAGGSAHSLAVKADGNVWAWGSNAYGQLGDGTTTDRLSPVAVAGLAGVTVIAASGGLYGAHSLALKPDGTVWAWGNNSGGQVGDGTNVGRSTPGAGRRPGGRDRHCRRRLA
jgi:alpha-tubulin suppressor-like RCC1 family protein